MILEGTVDIKSLFGISITNYCDVKSPHIGLR